MSILDLRLICVIREIYAIRGSGWVAGAGLRLCEGSPGVSRRRSNPGHPTTNPPNLVLTKH